MNKNHFFLLSVSCFWLSLSLYAQNNTSVFDKYMQAQTDIYRFNGNVLVAQNGKILYKKSFGYADYKAKSKLDSNSIFDIGSIAKEFTAMGILLLKDKGLISYSDTLRKFFPELPYNNVTIHQLLTHTSGIPDGFDLVSEYFDHGKIAYNNDLIRLLAKEKPAIFFKPGDDLMYSGTGFNLLASIIEKVSGQLYNTYMSERIFKPLGMTHTMVANGPRSTKSISGYADGFVYVDSLKTYINADSMHTGWTSYLAGITGEGMIVTTSGDLLRWDSALKNHNLLSDTTQAAMLSRQAEKATFPRVQFGYGMRVGANEYGSYFFHNGYFPGYLSMHVHYTDSDITAIVLSNNESHSEFIADALVAIALHKKIVMPYIHKEAIINDSLSRYVGQYTMPLTRPPYMVSFPVEIIMKNNKLYIHTSGGADIELRPESKTKFYFADGTDQQIEFETDRPGNQIKTWYIGWGVKKEIKAGK
ncbi:MAG: serine hydrolase domain-containing protein [Ferruginibacter sp.]